MPLDSFCVLTATFKSAFQLVLLSPKSQLNLSPYLYLSEQMPAYATAASDTAEPWSKASWGWSCSPVYISTFLPNLVTSHPCSQSFRDTIYNITSVIFQLIPSLTSSHICFTAATPSVLWFPASPPLSGTMCSISPVWFTLWSPLKTYLKPIFILKPFLITPSWIRHTLLLYTSYPPHPWFFFVCLSY